ncbi:hypothetical protein QMK33_13405 [Hymenobacter sp. H14-R3]|uniref:hypothetical protein n=1 Tax=Hymenobacter sp. H14-R3 TaxID=3046308 RepID=UPI0024BA1662|nr:hypothetical protein [Hymenobacter sp. H14-R3]MDJ0366152.1 hypothetical protein [Hymenobacter sp. H14-R3]
MKLVRTVVAGLLLAPLGLLAQTTKPPVRRPATPAARPAAPAARPAASASAPAAEVEPAQVPLALAPVTPAPDPNALKIKADQNPITHTLTVRCDAPGPTRFEINDKEGRPVLTKTVMVGSNPVVMNVASLPAGPYVVRCTAGEKRGTRLVQLQ